MTVTTTDDAVAWPDDAIEVARVADAWGIKGWLRIQPYATDPQVVFKARHWFLQPPAGKPPESARKTATQFYQQRGLENIELLGERTEKVENSHRFNPENGSLTADQSKLIGNVFIGRGKPWVLQLPLESLDEAGHRAAARGDKDASTWLGSLLRI